MRVVILEHLNVGFPCEQHFIVLVQLLYFSVKP